MNTQLIVYRTLMGLSQIELAKLLGVNRHTVKKWEAGVHNPQKEYLDEINGMVVKHNFITSAIVSAATARMTKDNDFQVKIDFISDDALTESDRESVLNSGIRDSNDLHLQVVMDSRYPLGWWMDIAARVMGMQPGVAVNFTYYTALSDGKEVTASTPLGVAEKIYGKDIIISKSDSTLPQQYNVLSRDVKANTRELIGTIMIYEESK